MFILLTNHAVTNVSRRQKIVQCIYTPQRCIEQYCRYLRLVKQVMNAAVMWRRSEEAAASELGGL
jgi:hypothetical protein